MREKQVIFIAGPNGSGKTTSAFTLLPDFLDTHEFVNADEIAKGLSPLRPSSMALRAGKLMRQRTQELLESGKSFALESTLSGRLYKPFIRRARSRGYTIGIIFLYLDSPALAVQRVAHRVARGGHGIPVPDIERRYLRGLKNLIHLYLPLAHWVALFDNSSQNEDGLRAIYFKSGDQTIVDHQLWEKINEQAR